MKKNKAYIWRCFVLLMLLMGVFTGFLPFSSPVNAQDNIIIVSNSKFFKSAEMDINVIAYYYNESGSLDIKENQTVEDLALGFGEHLIGCYNISTKKEENLIYATIEFTIKNNTEKVKSIKYKEDNGKWQKSQISNNIGPSILVNTTHFSTWSVVYNDWGYRRNITINSSYIDNSLINFPVFVNLSAANMNFSHAKTNGEDIRFTDINDNPLFYEIERWNSTNDTAYIWVNVTLISSSVDTVFYMYYNNSDATDNQSMLDVWDINFTCVQHMQEASAPLIDSSNTYQCNGTLVGDPDFVHDMKIDGGRDFDGNDYINISNIGNRVEGRYNTVSCWVVSTNLASTRSVISKIWDDQVAWDAPYVSYWLITTGANFGAIYAVNGVYTTGPQTPCTAGVKYYVTMTYDGSNIKLYVDGTYIGQVASPGNITYSSDHTDLSFGVTGLKRLSEYMTGRLDEVRISNIARNSSWIKASYHSMHTPAFLVVGSEEEKPAAPPGRVVYPNHVSFPNMQYEYVKITVNDSNYIQSEINVTFPSGFYYNYSINDDNELYIYANETGLYTYTFLVNATNNYWYNGSFTVITNYDYLSNILYDKLVNTWIWGIVCLILYWILILLSRKSILFSLGAIAISTYLLAFQQIWLPYWISLILLIIAWFSILRRLLSENPEKD